MKGYRRPMLPCVVLAVVLVIVFVAWIALASVLFLKRQVEVEDRVMNDLLKATHDTRLN